MHSIPCIQSYCDIQFSPKNRFHGDNLLRKQNFQSERKKEAGTVVNNVLCSSKNLFCFLSFICIWTVQNAAYEFTCMVSPEAELCKLARVRIGEAKCNAPKCKDL